MRYFFQFTAFFTICAISAQTPDNLRTVKDQEIDSIINLHQEKESLKFLSLLPTVSYDALNNSVNVGVSISNISVFAQNRHRNKIELARLEAQLQQKADQEIQNLKFEIAEFEKNFQSFLFDLENYEIHAQLYEIQIGKHKAGEITTEDFLKQKLNFSQKFFSYLTAIENLKIQAQKINLEIDFSAKLKILENEKENLLQKGKNFGVWGSAPSTNLPAFKKLGSIKKALENPELIFCNKYRLSLQALPIHKFNKKNV